MENRITTYGLIGYPLGHSLSPLMHNTAFEELGVEATYQLFPLKENEVEKFIKDLKSEDSPIFGLNVTVPYKEKVIPFLDSLNPYAEKVKAVNTILIGKDRQLIGYNTDGPGFLTHLIELGINPRGKRIVVLGAGGAARAILSVLCMIPERAESIKIYDIEPQKAETLASDLREKIDLSIVDVMQSIDDLNIELADILINTTPIGMKKDDEVLVDPELLHSEMFVYDVIYNPEKTRLLQLAEEKGAKISNGLGMLFYQGVLAFERWAEIDLPEKIKNKMKYALLEGLKRK